MSANTKVAATFHGAPDGEQLASLGQVISPASDARQRYLDGEEEYSDAVEHPEAGLDLILDADPERLDVQPEPTPEQALRAHVADLLTDVDHFHTCADPNNCTCLLGRIRWAIAADELPKPDQTTAAVDTLARHIIGLRMWQDDFGAQAWQEIPEVAAHDFEAITDRVKALIADSDPSTTDYDDAYTHLRSRVKEVAER